MPVFGFKVKPEIGYLAGFSVPADKTLMQVVGGLGYIVCK